MRELTRPPIGIMPKEIWLENRLDEIRHAAGRYLNDLRPVPDQWLEEIDWILEELSKTGAKK